MTEKLEQALDTLNITYQEVAEIANGITKPVIEPADKIIKYLNDNIQNLTTDQLRDKMLELQLAASSIAAIKEKSAMKASLADALQKEKYAISFGKAEGTAAAKANIALLDSQPETVSEILNNLVANLIRAKLDSCHRLVQVIQSIIMSRLSEAKYLNIGSADKSESPF